MANSRPTGPCCLCGVTGPLSFEHVPPQSAFNKDTVLLAEVKRMLGRDWWPERHNLETTPQERGAGRYTLCEPCNTRTGGWYAGTCHLGMRSISASTTENRSPRGQ